MTLRIFRVDDGGESFWYAANADEEALELWEKDHGMDRDEDPEDRTTVHFVQLVDAAGITITDDDNLIECPGCSYRLPCPHCRRRGWCTTCHGLGQVVQTKSLLEWLHAADGPGALGATVF